MENVSSSNGPERYPGLRLPGFGKPYMECRIGGIYSERSQRGADDMELLSAALNDGIMPRFRVEGKDNSGKDKSNHKVIYKGDMVHNPVRMWQGVNGVSNYDGIVSPTYTVLMPNGEIDSHYSASLFKTPNLIGEFRKYSQGLTSGTWNLRYPQIRSIKLYTLSLQEQHEISVFISTLEERIGIRWQLVNSLKRYKRGLLHGILHEKIRVTESVWSAHKIGGYLNSRNIKQLPTPDASLMALTTTGGVCDKRERYDRGSLVGDASTKLYKRTDLNDFMYGSSNLNVGSIGLNLYGSAVVSNVYKILSISGASPWFISEAIQQKPVLHQVLKYRQGYLYGQCRTYAEDFLGVSARMPPLETQRQIGTAFSRIEYKTKNE